MCKKCFDAAKKYFPAVADNDIGDLLLSATAFPMGSAALVRRQLQEAAFYSDGTLEGAIAYADAHLSTAIDNPTGPAIL